MYIFEEYGAFKIAKDAKFLHVDNNDSNQTAFCHIR